MPGFNAAVPQFTLIELLRKKIARLTVLLGLLLTLSACSDPPSPADEEAIPADDSLAANIAPTNSENALPDSHSFIQQRLGDLDSMHERRVIRLLTVYSIGRYYMDGAREKGLVYETSKHFEKFINKRFGRKHARIHVVVIPVARNQLIPALLNGRGDIIDASLSITEERKQQLDFSIPASKPVSEILVTGPSAPAIESINDLAGQAVYLRHSSSYRESVEALNQRFSRAGREPINIVAVSELLEDDDLVEMVNAGLLPWAIVDDYKMHWWADAFPHLTVRDDIVFHSDVRMAWGFRRDSPLLKAAINDFLKKHREGTLIGNVLSNRYIRDFDWTANALSGNDYSRFEKLRDTFKKYGEQFDIDYLVLAAQGYQESRLQQSARNSSGAIGIMQIKRSTAHDHNVNIRNIDEAEGNIHAGAKYMDFLRRRYFDAPEIDATNQLLLTLATYNLGPSRMINLRNKAAKMGYDRNIWFDNVELAAAKHVGREPVQYVANIYKYYLAYLMTAELVLQRQAARARAGIESPDGSR